MILIGEFTARLRKQIKATRQEAFITDRFLYSLVSKHAKLLLRRQDSANKLMRFDSVFRTLEPEPLETVDTVSARCSGLSADCTIRRTCVLPAIFEGYYGPLIRSVSSLDGSQILNLTQAVLYESIRSQKNFKYNPRRYYWWADGRIYIPDVPWDDVRIEALWEDDIRSRGCGTPVCTPEQDRPMYIPEFLFSEIEEMVKRDLGILLQIPADNAHDNKSPVR